MIFTFATSATGAYEFIKKNYIAYDSCQPYIACSSDSQNDFCQQVDTSCIPENICRTCDMKYLLWDNECRGIEPLPNATIAEYGTIQLSDNSVHQIKAEVFARGPVAAAVNGKPLHSYTGGIYSDESESKKTTHIVSIVGWGKDDTSGDEYWIIRNRYVNHWDVSVLFHCGTWWLFLLLSSVEANSMCLFVLFLKI